MGYTTKEESLQYVKDVKEMGENLDFEIDKEALENFRDKSWPNPPLFNHELAILTLWKNLDAFISRQIAEIQQAQAQAQQQQGEQTPQD